MNSVCGRGRTDGATSEADAPNRMLLERAIATRPGYAEAHALLARSIGVSFLATHSEAHRRVGSPWRARPLKLDDSNDARATCSWR